MIDRPVRVFLIATLVAAAGTPGFARSAEPRIDSVTSPPPEVVERLDLSPFYTKHVDVEGFSIVASGKVADAALLEAAWLIRRMIGHRPDILAALARNKVRFTIMAATEMTTDVPEHSDLRPRDYWDKRARGLGATTRRPAVSCGEENLLRFPGDPYSTENILIHEFGHAVHEMGLSTVDPTFDDRLMITWRQAIDAGLWEGKYAATNRQEYWAEGVQSWFDTNRENDGDHNHVNTRDELREYDPGLAKLVHEVFGDGDWKYTRPDERRSLPHLAAWDAEAAPRFQWPEEVVRRYELHQARERAKADPDSDLWTDLAAIPLDKLEGLRSPASSKRANVLFVNRREQPLSVEWIDFDGKRRVMDRVAPGEHRLHESWKGHLFVVTDPEGSPLTLIAAEGDNGRCLVGSAE